MKAMVLGALSLVLCTFEGFAQNYQRSYGKVFNTDLTDQQELYDICSNDSSSILVSGTFRNINTFPEIAFYGTVSKVNRTGEVQWYKGYLPNDFAPFESFFISSVIKTGNDEIYCFGSLLSNGPLGGYILIKLDGAGEVVFARKVEDTADLLPKAMYKDGFIYATIHDKVVKYDLDGNLMLAKRFQHLIFRDINSGPNNSIILTGEYADTDPGSGFNLACPIITLDGNLEMLGGQLYITAPGGFYGQSIIATNNDQLIVGGPGGSYFCVAPDGEIQWASLIEQFSTPVIEDAYDVFWDLQESADGNILGILAGFHADLEVFQNYSAFCTINPATGLVISSKDVKEGHFAGIDHISVNGLLLDNDTIYAVGNTVDDDLQYKLNYIHRTGLSDVGCGESARPATIMNWADQILPVVPYQAGLITDVVLFNSNISLFSVDIPINYNDQSCSGPTVNIDEPSSGGETLIYPNPVGDVLFISSSSTLVDIKVLDILGGEIPVAKLSETELDLSHVRPGIYLIQITDAQNHIAVKKVMKN
jgi:hypothetical protein